MHAGKDTEPRVLNHLIRCRADTKAVDKVGAGPGVDETGVRKPRDQAPSVDLLQFFQSMQQMEAEYSLHEFDQLVCPPRSLRIC